MKLNQIKPECFIVALFIRDDNERFLLGSGAYEFKEDQKHFAANTFSNDVVEVQGNDGVFLAGQVRRAATQVFDGYIGGSTSTKEEVEKYRRDFLAFFRKNHFYTVVYVFSNGASIQRRRGFIVDAPEAPELYQIDPEYHIGMNFEDVNYYSYTEDENGEETYSKNAIIKLSTGSTGGGLVWDEKGVIWDGIGAVWEDGDSGGPTTIMVDSIDNVYPIWTVVGPAENPMLSDLTTNTTITYSGNVAEGQTLVVDMFNQTALLNGTSVIENITGDWIYLAPGLNKMVYIAVVPAPPTPVQPVIGDLTYMQDFAKYDSAGIQAIVASMVEEQVYTLKDSRDQQDYKISKLKSGQVLMAEDLRIQNYKCTPEDTDITEGVFQIPASTPGNYPSGSTAETLAVRVEDGTAYYSWALATAGCNPADGDAKISIMPKGWGLPTRNDWLKLLQSYPTKENIMAEPVPSIKAVSYWDGSGINQALKGSVYRWASTISEDNKAGNPDFLICGDSAPYVRGQSPIGNGFAIRGILKAGG